MEARRAGGFVIVMLASSAVAVAVVQSTAAASCMTTTFPTASVTGRVVSTSIDPDTGVFAEVQSDAGAMRTVVFYGRNPNNKREDGTENSVEDAWTGELPAVGGQYTITGAEFEGEDGPLGVSSCAESPSVAMLVAPPVSADDATADDTATATKAVDQSSNGNGWSGATTVAILIGIVLGVGALIVVVRRRTPTTDV